MNTQEPASEPLSTVPADWMDDGTRMFWDRIAPIVKKMQVAQESDRPALELLSMCLSQAHAAYREFKDRKTVVYSTGAEQVSPEFTIMSKMIAQAMKIMVEFGMTPSSRTRLKTVATGDQENPLQKFLERGTGTK